MRIAVISDIHGNLEALEAVLADLDRREVEAVYNLGDMVGYGPDPEAVTALVRARGIPTVMGNHELGLTDPRTMAWFNPQARLSLEASRRLLTPATLAWLGALPRFISEHGCRFVHGFPPDSVTSYLFEAGSAKLTRALTDLEERMCFVGHTHELVIVSLTEGKLLERPFTAEPLILPRYGRYIVNVGAVGQPRDGDNRAKYAIWDTGERRLMLQRVPYDIEVVAAKIRRVGLPESNARRLY